jgi:hypothetical protein
MMKTQEITEIIACIVGIICSFIIYIISVVNRIKNNPKKRSQAIAAIAKRLGLKFHADWYPDLDWQYHFLDKLHQGENHYAFNVISGKCKNNDILAFDYHYQVSYGKSEGREQIRNYYFSCLILRLPVLFPKLLIELDKTFSNLYKKTIYKDINFESYEFSRKFYVRSEDKKFAYDFCNARMMEYLLNNDDLNIEVDNNALSISFSRQLEPEQIELNIERLVTIRSLMPGYFFPRGH